MPTSVIMLTAVTTLMVALVGGLVLIGNNYTLNGIKSQIVGDGQHGTARFASDKEIRATYEHITFKVSDWRQAKSLPKAQGLVIGCKSSAAATVGLVDTGDVHTLMLGAAGVGKTAFFLYPNLEYACAAGMSFLCTDTKGDLFRNYAGIAQDYYGYNVAVLDLRNPTRSHGNNMLHLVNKYMDIYLAGENDSEQGEHGDNHRKENITPLAAKAKAEKYAKIISKTIITSGGSGDYGQNSYFYDSAEGLLTAVIILVAECCPHDKQHIISVFKLIQDLLEPSKEKGKSHFQMLMRKLPGEHKARWFAGSALNSGEQAMQSVISTAMSRLNAFLDSELEQILCFDTAVDAEKFCNTKSALFIVMPEEDQTKYFLVSLIVQQLYREILSVADEQGGKLKNRVMMFLDEIGTIPKIDSAEMMFSASRSRRVSIVAIIQSFAQLEKNYGKEGSSIIVDNCQDTIFGGFAPNSEAAEILSKSLGNQTILSGTINRSSRDPSQTLQMISRPLMTPDELKALPKGHFVVTKTGTNPMRTQLKLFLKWGITFEKPFEMPETAARKVAYAGREELERAISLRYPERQDDSPEFQRSYKSASSQDHAMQSVAMREQYSPRRRPFQSGNTSSVKV